MAESSKTPKRSRPRPSPGVIKRCRYSTQTTSAGVLQVVLSDTVSFSNVGVWHKACKEVESTGLRIEDMLVSQGKKLLLATRIGAKRPRDNDSEAPSQRELDDVQARVDSLVKEGGSVYRKIH